jgi:hypothetical protein
MGAVYPDILFQPSGAALDILDSGKVDQFPHPGPDPGIRADVFRLIPEILRRNYTEKARIEDIVLFIEGILNRHDSPLERLGEIL